MLVKEKLAAIRKQMQFDKVSAYIIPSSDPHCSEYLSDHYKCLAFASGFTGSAGTLIITQAFAGLWTDSRYFIQAEEELKNSGYELVKLVVPHTPEYIDWLSKRLESEAIIAFDEQIMPAERAILLKNSLDDRNITYQHKDYLTTIWDQRPEPSSSAAFLLTDEQSGKSASSKLTDLRAAMKTLHIDVHVISSLDDIAWLFNIRGNDVRYNPVVMSHALIGKESAILFIDSTKLTPSDQAHLHAEGIKISPYESVFDALGQVPPSSRILVDSKRICYSIYKAIPSSVEIIDQMNPTVKFKAVKNKIEQNNIREAMVKDGVALTRFMYWLEKNIGKTKITECSVAEKLESFRAEQKSFMGISFTTIAAYLDHGALPHYTPSLQHDVELKNEGLLLLDSGGQYLYGTTDITRTLPLGKNTPEEKTDYTLVLKALIEGSACRFPKGTCGYQLDAIIRKPLWDYAINYGHGTGHGVGYFLNVHEGPQNISPVNHPVALVPGMVTSIEPGIYRPQKHGVRIENVVLTTENSSTSFDTFYSFETLTLAHIDTTLIEKSLLSESQMKWLNQYNESVLYTLSPFLTPEESSWLTKKTKAI